MLLIVHSEKLLFASINEDFRERVKVERKKKRK
jgi:hypothetical protein